MRRILALVAAAATIQCTLGFMPVAPVRSAARTQGVVRYVGYPRVGCFGCWGLVWGVRQKSIALRGGLRAELAYAPTHPPTSNSMVSGMKVDDKTEVKVRNTF